MDVAEILSHHILDHHWGYSLGGVELPITTHTITLLSVSVIMLIGLYWISKGGASTLKRLLTAGAEEYVTFIRDGMVLPNMGTEGNLFCLPTWRA